MHKITQRCLAGLLAVLICLSFGLFIAIMMINPNDYRADLAKLIQHQIGREVAINGDISLAIFPALRVGIEKMTLSNHPLFQEPLFVSVDKSKVSLKLVPLFFNRLEINALVLEGLKLTLSKNKQGINNWDDLSVLRPATQPTAQVKSAPGFKTFTLDNLVFKNAQIRWDNQQTGTHSEIINLQLQTDRFTVDETVTLNVTINLTTNLVEPPLLIDGLVHLRVNKALDHLLVSDSRIQGQTLIKRQPITATLTIPKAEANLKQQTLKVTDLKIQLKATEITTNVDIEHFLEKPTAQGTVALSSYNLKSALEQWKLAFFKTSDEKVFTSLNLNSDFSVNSEHAALNNLNLNLDDSHASGTVKLEDYTKPKLIFNLTVDNINLDRYLPPQTNPTSSHPEWDAELVQIAKSLTDLKELNTEGELAISQLLFKNTRLKDLRLTLNSKTELDKRNQ